jgi:hypothetical protein
MEIEVSVSVIHLKRAFRRLLARLHDESEAGSDSVIFSANGDSLEIAAGATSEILSATVAHPGRACVPHPVFCGIARTLRFHRGRVIAFAFSPGALRIGRTDYRHPSIAVLAPGGGQAIIGTKPAKPQHL